MEKTRASNKTVITVAIIFFPITIYWFFGMGILFVMSKYSDLLDELREYSASVFAELEKLEIWTNFHKSYNIVIIATWPLFFTGITLYQVIISIILIAASLLALIVNVYVEITIKISSN